MSEQRPTAHQHGRKRYGRLRRLCQTLGVSIMKPQLGDQKCVPFYAINHAMFICYAA